MGQTIHTQGGATAEFGDTSQAANCESDPATSDEVFDDLGERLEVVSMGDVVEINGTGQFHEYRHYAQRGIGVLTWAFITGGIGVECAIRQYPGSHLL